MDGVKGTIADMRELGVWDTFQVKTQTIKTAIESACMLLRIDDIVRVRMEIINVRTEWRVIRHDRHWQYVD